VALGVDQQRLSGGHARDHGGSAGLGRDDRQCEIWVLPMNDPQYDEILDQLTQIRETLDQLRRDIQTILENIPIQMIGDSDAEVQ
jgi:hypothetical protein